MQQPAKNRECKEKIRIDLPQQTDKMVFVEYLLSLRASAQDFRGNPPVERNQVTITSKNRRNPPFFGANRYISPLSGGLPRPVCAPVSQ